MTTRMSLLTTLLALLLLTQFSYPQPITLTPLVLQGQPAPGTGGGKFFAFGQVSINDAGDVVFNVGVTGGNSNGGVFLASGGKIQPILLGGPAPPVNRRQGSGR